MPQRILGLDIGDVRIGVARSDPLGIIATPLTIIDRRDIDTDIEAILKLALENDAVRIIIGLPFSMDGSLGPQAEKVRVFTEELRRRTGIPVEYRDERLSTVIAREKLKEAGKTARGTRYDAAAAALILQSYLNESSAGAPPPEES